jgi:hypothetical protein
MRNWAASIGLICIGLLGCSNISGTPAFSTDDSSNSGLATVVIKLPQNNQTGSRAIGITNTKNYTDYFEVGFRNNTSGSHYYATASSTNGYVEATIPEGNYDILLFAGDKDYYLNYSPLLLASDFVRNVDITLIGPNVINMVLKTIDFELTIPEKAIVAELFPVVFTVDLKNPLISNINDAYIRYFGNGGIIRDTDGDGIVDIDTADIRLIPDNFTTNELVYTYNTSLMAPLIPGIHNILFYGYTKLFKGSTWFYGNAFHPDLGQYYKKMIDFVEEADADIELNISWEE